MSAVPHEIEAVVTDPTIRGGRPVLAGTRITISDFAAAYQSEKLSVDQMTERFHLQLWQTHAALAYYYRNQAEIDSEIRSNEEEAERLLATLRSLN